MYTQTNTKPVIDGFLKTIKENTERNAHTENCVLIAYNFGTHAQRIQSKEIRDQHNKLGHIPYFTQLARDYLTKVILFNMKNKKLSRAINKVL